MPGPSNPDNVPTNDSCEKYRTSTGTPVRNDLSPTFGASAGALFGNNTNPTEVEIGGRGQPVKNTGA